MNRKKFLQLGAMTGILSSFGRKAMAGTGFAANGPVVISTWDTGLRANKGAWEELGKSGTALDAVEKGVKVTESEINCCVGLGANPDREGFVTLDACIMDHQFNCGSVAFLERIKHPISVARRVMEKTPHVMLVGSGAQDFALAEGFPLEPQELSPGAEKAYKAWLKKAQYHPKINRETQGHGPFAPDQIDGQLNHDTIGMLALDEAGHLAGSCTTSGLGFKMRGRVGDSPIIGAGLYVDGEVGACTATGQGEDVIRVAGSHAVVELMRQGYGPDMACQKIIERIARIKGEAAKDIQVAFIALNKNGVVGACALHPGFRYALKTKTAERLVTPKTWFDK